MLGFIKDSPQSARYEELASGSRNSRVYARDRPRSRGASELRQTDFYTSHEALLLGYEKR